MNPDNVIEKKANERKPDEPVKKKREGYQQYAQKFRKKK